VSRSRRITIPADLWARVQRFADAEGITITAFVLRCIEDAVARTEGEEKPQPISVAETIDKALGSLGNLPDKDA
jgi:hypothetical protein